MVQALCRQNGTGPYSGSGSTKAKLAPPSSFSLRPTLPRRPAASSSRPSRRHSKRPPQFLFPIVVSALGDPVQDGPVASLPRPGKNITGTTVLGARNSADIWHKLLLGADRQVRGCACAAKDGRKREQRG